MPKHMKKMDRSMRNPKKNRGINADGSNQSGGGGTGKHKGGMGMAMRKGSSMKMKY